ncbi:hypothetical protein [Mycobacteroides abscessus]|uniref:hypothetical protein n=1 Tax=Mycobacteroides abscessus TaxID=36809 RepID=UPI001F2F0835|nr:hypothetical protein [Mycobacteroides abscessus]
MQGKTADSVSSAYKHHAAQLQQQGQSYASISGWMTDAAGAVRKAKRQISDLVSAGTQEIRDALDSELQGTPVTPSSTELTDKYRGDIATVASTLTSDLDSIGHALHGDPGSSRTPTYVRAASTTPTVEQAAVHQGITGESQALAVEPQRLPEMPRATTTHPTESPTGAGAPSTSTSSAPHPTLAHLIGGQGGTPTGAPTTGSPHASSPNTGASSTQSHQSTEQHQAPKPAALPRIPSIPLDGLPAAAAESVATAVTSAAAAHQLPTTTITPSTPPVPMSTGITPGVSGTPPMTPVTPVTPAPLAPIGGGGGLSTPAVTQPATPAPQATPASPTTPSPTPTRSPAADLNWIQQRYGLAPGIESPKSETALVPAFFITDLPEDAAHLHRVLATIRQAFDGAGWSQPLAVATIRKGFETRTVYVTADGLSIHPHGVLLPHGVTPLDEMPDAPTYSELSGSLMVSEKLMALIPRGWEVEGLLSTMPSDENSQSAEQYQELLEGEELLPCNVSHGRSDVTAGEAMSAFARAALGSGGCSDLDSESARLRSARWVGVQPAGYQGLLARWYLSDAAESMSLGAWGEAVYCSERYLSISDTKRQVA